MVRLFGFSVWIDEDEYQGEIPARTWTEAAEMCESFGAEVNGMIEDESVICDMCGAALKDAVETQPDIYYWLEGNVTGH